MMSAFSLFRAADTLADFRREFSAYCDFAKRKPWLFGRKAHAQEMMAKRAKLATLAESVERDLGPKDPAVEYLHKVIGTLGEFE